MALTEDITKQLNSIKFVPIEEPKNQLHLYADFVELMTLFSNGDYVTPTHLISRLKNVGVLIVEKIDSDSGDEIGSLNDQISDKEEAWSKDVFSVINDRSGLFDQKYPFYFSDNKIALKKELTIIQKIYLMLLLSSNLNFIPQLTHKITSDFEQISFAVLRNYFPIHAKVKQFGKKSDYTGTAIEKIRKLAQDMNLDVNENELEGISPGNTQEEGLDLVGWIPFEDEIPSMVSLLGQCACGKGWESKQNETRRYENFFEFYKTPPIHALFIPYALGMPNKKFFQAKNINRGSLVFDRKRILDLTEDPDFFYYLESNIIVRRFVAYEEGIV